MDIEKRPQAVGGQEQQEKMRAKFRAQAEEAFLKLKGTKPTESDEKWVEAMTDTIARWSKLAEEMGYTGDFMHFFPKE